MVFRKRRELTRGEHWIYNGSEVEVVDTLFNLECYYRTMLIFLRFMNTWLVNH